jgi:WD40 repeat protein
MEVDIFALRPLSREMLRVVIEEPARLAGLSVDHELVDRLVADTDCGEALPLLAFTLNQLADGLTRGGTLSAARYDELGRVQGALVRHADAALAAASDASGLTAQEVLSALVRLAMLDGAGQPTRRRIDLGELSEAKRSAFTAFVDHRLLTTMGGDGGNWVGVAHEALLTSWPPLADAIADRTVALHTARSVEQAAAEWDRAGRPEDHLWERGRVAEARRVLDPADLSTPAAAFLRACQRHGDRVRVRAIALLSAALLLVSSGGVTALAQWRVALAQRGDAQEQRHLAVGRQLVGQATVLRYSQPRIALALSIEAYRIAPSLPEVRDTLLNMQAGYYSGRLLPGMGAVHGVAFSPDGRTLATAQHNNAVGVWRLPATSPVRRLPATGPMYCLAFSPNGEFLAAAGERGTIEVWNANTLRTVVTLRAGSGALYSVAFNRDSTLLAAGGSDSDVVLWDIRKGWRPTRHLRGLGPGGSIYGLSFSPTRSTLVTASSDPDSALTFWDIESGRGKSVPGHNGAIRAVAFSSDGSRLASGGNDGSVRLWDSRSQLPIADAVEHTGAVQTVSFSSDGRTLASGGDDGSVRLWDVHSEPQSLRQLTSLLGPTDRILGVAFSPDGRTLAGAGSDFTLGLWNVSGPADENLPAVYAAAAFGPRGVVATAGRDRRPLLWVPAGDHGAPVLRNRLPGERPRSGAAPTAYGMAFSSDGTVLATPVSPESAALWGVVTGTPRYFRGGGRPVHAVALSPRGDYLASASVRADRDVDLWSTATHSIVQNSPTVHTGAINGVALSPRLGHPRDLLLAIAREDGAIVVSAMSTLRDGPLKLLPEYGTVPVNAVALSYDGSMLAGGSTDGTVRVWHVSDWTELQLATPPAPVRPAVAVAFSRDAKMFGAVSDDGVIKVWDMKENGALLATLTGPPGTTSLAFRPDGDVQTFVTADQDGTFTLWDIDPGRVLERLCSGPRLSLTQREWSALVPGEPYGEVCG